MLRRHDFNSEWYGSPVGLVDDLALLDLPAEERDALLAPYAFVELRGTGSVERAAQARAAGFVQVDLNVAFRIGLARLAPTPSDQRLRFETAEEADLAPDLDQVMPFIHERFLHLPGMTVARLNERYALWSRRLLEEQPATCVRALSDGRTQGWFLARPLGPGSLELTLAMLHRAATVSGQLLYRGALLHFAGKGFRLGQAKFSATNTPVLNIYAHLGARFTGTTDYWMRW